MGDLKVELSRLTKQQKDAVLHEEGMALALAGPGSGKTRVITLRSMVLLNKYGKTSELRESGVVLTMSFNRAAALEMKERAEKLATEIFGNEAEEKMKLAHFSTIHSYCYTIIKEYCKLKDQRVPEIVDNEKQDKIIPAVYEQVTGRKIGSSEELKRIKMYISELEMGAGVVSDPLIVQIENAYKEYKTQNSLIDFEDMQLLARNYLKEDCVFCDLIRKKFMFVQVDEAQDLSFVQREISELISGGSAFYVADDDQSIYGFRGAMPTILKQMARGGASLYLLGENFRSNEEIVKLAVSFVEQNGKRFKKNILSPRGRGGACCIEAFSTYIRQAKFAVNKILAENKNGKTISVLYRNNASNLVILYSLYFECKKKHLSLHPHIMGDYISLAKMTGIKKISDAIGNKNKMSMWQELVKNNMADVLMFSPEISGKRKFFGYIVFELIEILCKSVPDGKSIYDELLLIDQFAMAGESDKSVTFSTIHSSKGLEFDTVVIVDNALGEFPFGKCEDENELFEERRLMYVAMTRAKNKLYITYPCKIWTHKLTAGIFVNEIASI